MSDFLRILDVDGDHLDINHGGQPGEAGRRLLLLTTVSRQSVALDERKARELVAFAQAWLDAPRLAARDSAEVVASERMVDVTISLLKTTAGEWGARTDYADDETQADVNWWIGEGAERDARGWYAELRGKSICECGAEADDDEMTGTEDGEVCPTCAAELQEEFKVMRFRCPGCGWTGTGADIIDADAVCHGEPGCPHCETSVEVVVVEPAPSGEAG